MIDMLIIEGKIERLVVALSAMQSNYSAGRSVEILRAGMFSTTRAELLLVPFLEKSRGVETWVLAG